MPKEVNQHRDLTEKLIKSGFKAAKELIKVAEAPIIKTSKKDVAGEDLFDLTDELAAEKMKNAAAAKKLAIFDAFDILDKIKEKQADLDAADGKPKEDKKKPSRRISFPEE